MTDIKDTAGATMPETAEQATPLKLSMRVEPIEPKGNLIAFAKVTVADSLVIEGLRVCTGDKGIYVNMPSVQGKDGQWHDTAYPITSDLRARLTEAAEAGYNAEIEKMEATLMAAKSAKAPAIKEDSGHDARRDTGEKPSALEALKNGKEQAKATPVKAAAGKEDKSL